MADIFISYTAADRDWAFWIAKELEALGHIPHVHEWEIERGGDIYAWMEQRHDTADHVLCVVSDGYLKAPYSTLERNAALWQAASNRPGFVLFVAVRACKLPTLSDHIRRCELYGVPEDAARIRFREFMAKREPPAAAAFPGTVFAVSNIPIRVPEHFLGRDDALAAIDTALARYDGRVAITALHGLRGVGKTTLAAAYAERHRGDYRATWWIRAQTPDGMRADLVALGVRLNWVAPDEKEEPALKTVMERLVHEGEGILLIYDNAVDADALKPCLPRGGVARVLVTSGARPLIERTLAIWEKVLGAEHPGTATSLNNLAVLLQDQGDLAGARPLHERALAIREKVLGAEHPRTATSLGNLALLLQDQGDLAGARPLHERALAIDEKVLGAEHPDTARSLSNLGRLLRDLGQPDKAEPLFIRAIAVGDKALGTEHPLTRRYQSHYARLLLMTDRPAEALQLGRAALAAHERANGPNHPWTKDSAGVTADALAALGLAAEAKALRKKYSLEDRAV